LPRVIIARTATEIEGLRGRWQALTAAAPATIFQSFLWNLLAARLFWQEQPCVVCAEDSNGLALIPACVTALGIALLGETLFDYRDVLADDVGLLSAAWNQLAEPALPVEVGGLYGDAACERWKSSGFYTQPLVNSPCVRRADIDAHEFEARHHRTARSLRRLARMGICVRRYPGTDTALARMIYERKGEQKIPSNLLADRTRRQFLVTAAGLGGCDLFTLESAGSLIAALVTFRDGYVRRFYTTYYDHGWAHYSPGIALLMEVTRRSLAEGLDCDYMTGEQSYKMRFATSSVRLYRAAATAEMLAGTSQLPKLVAA